MAFKYGPSGQPIEVADAGNPMTLHYLGRCVSFLEVLAASDEMPAPLKAATEKLVQEVRHHVQSQIAQPPG
jgi:hypothetical protein